MRWKYYALGHDDVRANKHIRENLSLGAYNHTLTKKLLTRFTEYTGPIVLVAFDNLDLDRDHLYAYATYAGGKSWFEAAGRQTLAQEDCPIGGLAVFLEHFLRSSEEAVVLIENSNDTRQEYLANWRPRESRVVFYGQEVYHVLLPMDARFDAIEAAVRESSSKWTTGVCSFASAFPDREITSEAFFEAIVTKTAHVFTTALDQEGFLIWSPGL